VLGLTTGLVRADALNAESELARNRDRQIDLILPKRMGSRVVRHEFADQLALDDKGDEGGRGNTLRRDCCLEGIGKVGGLDIRNAYGLRVLDVTRPWRVAIDRPPVLLGKSSPSNEAHHPGVVEEKDGAAFAA